MRTGFYDVQTRRGDGDEELTVRDLLLELLELHLRLLHGLPRLLDLGLGLLHGLPRLLDLGLGLLDAFLNPLDLGLGLLHGLLGLVLPVDEEEHRSDEEQQEGAVKVEFPDDLHGSRKTNQRTVRRVWEERHAQQRPERERA